MSKIQNVLSAIANVRKFDPVPAPIPPSASVIEVLTIGAQVQSTEELDVSSGEMNKLLGRWAEATAKLTHDEFANLLTVVLSVLEPYQLSELASGTMHKPAQRAMIEYALGEFKHNTGNDGTDNTWPASAA